MSEIGEVYRRSRKSGRGNGVPNDSSLSRVPAAASSSSRDPPRPRWGSNLSTQRRERTVIWASCLHKVQTLRRGGSWRSEAGVSEDDIGNPAAGWPGNGNHLQASLAAEGGDQEIEDELNVQLDFLDSLTYPNSCISPQDAGFMVAALCEAVPPSSAELCARVARLFVLLGAKQQQKVALLPWQLNVVLKLFVRSSAVEASPPQQLRQEQREQHAHHEGGMPTGRRECIRALAQLLYDNGERLGTHFETILPPLLGLAAPSTEHLDARQAALDALANLCLKNWAGLTPPQRQAVCFCLTQNFVAYWRPCSSAAQAFADASAAPAPAETKILASSTRGLALAVARGGVSSALEAYLARIIHALNHLVQPTGKAETAAMASERRSNSASRSRSRGRGLSGRRDEGLVRSPTRESATAAGSSSSSSSSLADPRARVRLQALALLEAMAAKDAKVLYPHWSLFFAPCDEGVSATVEVGGRAREPSPVLPAGLLSIMENDHAPQVRAAAAAAATALVKGAPLRKWISPSTSTDSIAATAGAATGSGGWGIGRRTESMMLRLQRSLVQCISREESPAVLAKLCACSGALMAGLPYAVASTSWSEGTAHRESPPGDAFRTNTNSLEGSLRHLLSGLAKIMTDEGAETSARISASQALTAAFSLKEPIVVVDAFLHTFRCDPVPLEGRTPSRESGIRNPAPLGAAAAAAADTAVPQRDRLRSSLPLRAGSAEDNRGNRFVGGRTNRGAVERATSGYSSTRGRGGRGDEDSSLFRRNGRTRPLPSRGDTSLSSGQIPRSPPPRVDIGEAPSLASRSDPGKSFVSRLIGSAESPGQLRAHALGLLARVARSYPAHLSVGSDLGDDDAGVRETWKRASALLLRCFADPDQNLRLHALKVVEALLLAREEQAIPFAVIGTPGFPEDGEGRLFVDERRGNGRGEEGSGRDGGGSGGGLWKNLIQKHLQRALDDPYHGVRAVACSCHGCLLDCDWDAFSDEERGRCLDRLLVATRDSAAGVNILACKVLAGLMAKTGQEEAGAWCRDPDFLEQCAARLQEMLEDPKDTIRAQAMLAVGNLSWSLHRVRTQGTTAATIVRGDPCDRSTSSSISNGNSGSNVVVQDLDYNRPPDPRAGELVSLPRLRSLCDAATRLVATEPDHAAGSAARALGYLAWALDPEGIGGGGVGRRGRREVSTVLPTNGESETKDRRLQDEAVSTLAARLDSAVGGTGGSTADSAFRKGDRKLDGPAAKCRWNCCIALGVILSAPGVQVRASEASWALAVGRALQRAMEADKHLKVRTHAALTLKTITAVGECDDHLPAVFTGSLRALQDCQQRRVVVSDPAQMRFAAALEAALRALALKILLDLVLGDGNTSARNGAPLRLVAPPAHDRWMFEVDCKAQDMERCAAGRDFRERQEAPAVEVSGTDAYLGGGKGSGEIAEGNEVGDLDSGAKDSTRATLILREHADDLLELVASQEAVTALSSAELLPYRRHVPREFYTALGIGEKDVSESIAIEPPAAAIVLAQSILYIASEVLLRLFDREGPVGSEEPVASRQSWQACTTEASRRRLRIIAYFRDKAAVGEQERGQGTLLFEKFPGCRLAGGGVIDHDDEM